MTRVSGEWLAHPGTQAVMAALAARGAQALFVGGCVRNALLGLAVSDIDIATDAAPEDVIRLARAAGIKAVATGLAHGTVTLVAKGHAHEVTTFRRDLATDGRRAVVAYSGSLTEDAARRDFTMNALYARADGEVIDPLGGLADLRARRVRFIGDATARIREDYLRSLRYFRLHAWYGDADQGPDADALAAIAANLDGLARLSRERITAELTKLLAAPDPVPSCAAMRACGVLRAVLPGADDAPLAPLVHLEQEAGAEPDALRRLAALGWGADLDELRLARRDRRRMAVMRDAATGSMGAAELGYRLGAAAGRDALLLRAAMSGADLPHGWEAALARGAEQDFPLAARDLMPRLSGPDLGARLDTLERRWIASDFALDREALLALA